MVLNCSLLVISLPKWNQRPIGLNCWNLAFKGAYIFCYEKFVYEKFVVKMEPLATPAENVPTPRSISCFLTSLLISQDSYTGATESHKEMSIDTSRLLVYNWEASGTRSVQMEVRCASWGLQMLVKISSGPFLKTESQKLKWFLQSQYPSPVITIWQRGCSLMDMETYWLDKPD